MPPRKSKAKKNADSQSRRSTRGAKAAADAAAKAATDEILNDVSASEQATVDTELPPTNTEDATSDVLLTVPLGAEREPEPIDAPPEKDVPVSNVDGGGDIKVDTEGTTTTETAIAPTAETSGSGMSLEQRQSKLDELRLKMVRLCFVCLSLTSYLLHLPAHHYASKPCRFNRRAPPSEDDGSRSRTA